MKTQLTDANLRKYDFCFRTLNVEEKQREKGFIEHLKLHADSRALKDHQHLSQFRRPAAGGRRRRRRGGRRKINFENVQNVAKFQKLQLNVARFRLYRHRFLRVNTRFAAFFKIYQII